MSRRSVCHFSIGSLIKSMGLEKLSTSFHFFLCKATYSMSLFMFLKFDQPILKKNSNLSSNLSLSRSVLSVSQSVSFHHFPPPAVSLCLTPAPLQVFHCVHFECPAQLDSEVHEGTPGPQSPEGGGTSYLQPRPPRPSRTHSLVPTQPSSSSSSTSSQPNH